MQRPASYDHTYTGYQLGRSRARRAIRRLYLANAARKLDGATIDFGCGVGDLLRRLPEGSIGLEINPHSVDVCRLAGLDVMHYDSDADDWRLTPLLRLGRRFRCLVVSHVLEHLDDPIGRLNRLMRAGEALGLERVLVVVPGKAGYRTDPTHRTFVDLGALDSVRATAGTRMKLRSFEYFPLSMRWLGNVLAHHELLVVYDRIADTRPADQPGAMLK